MGTLAQLPRMNELQLLSFCPQEKHLLLSRFHSCCNEKVPQPPPLNQLHLNGKEQKRDEQHWQHSRKNRGENMCCFLFDQLAEPVLTEPVLMFQSKTWLLKDLRVIDKTRFQNLYKQSINSP
jgi:hypothetical protein